jgi:molybdate transport system permease protein
MDSAFLLSLRVGLSCAILGLPPAVALGYLLARRNFFAKPVVTTVLLLPLVLPPVVTGYLLLGFFGREGMLGRVWRAFDIAVPFSLSGAVIAALVVGFPLYVASVRSAFETIDPRLEEVAETLGKKPSTVFWRVSLPLALPGIAAGFVLTFARALGEFGATAVLAGNIEGETRTLALAVYSLLDSPSGEAAATELVWLSVALAFLALVGYEALSRWQRRRLEIDHGH